MKTQQELLFLFSLRKMSKWCTVLNQRFVASTRNTGQTWHGRYIFLTYQINHNDSSQSQNRFLIFFSRRIFLEIPSTYNIILHCSLHFNAPFKCTYVNHGKCYCVRHQLNCCFPSLSLPIDPVFLVQLSGSPSFWD